MAGAGHDHDWEQFILMLAPASGERILDVGAGDGSTAARVILTSKGAEVYGVDPDEKKVAASRRDRPAVKSSVAAAESLPFPDFHFDKVYSTMALHHFADLDRALAEIARVLRHGGAFVVLEVEPGSWLGRFFRLVTKITREKVLLMSQPQLRSKLESGPDFHVVSSLGLGSKYLVQAART